MVREFTLPDVGEGVTEGELLEWHVEVGDSVTEDQVVAEVETDKAVVDVPAPVNGTVRELCAEPGEVVPVGDVIITFDVEGEASTDASKASSAERSSADSRAAEPRAGEGDESGKAAGGDAGSAGDAVATSAEPEDGAETDDAGESADSAGAERGGRVFAAPSARRLARELDVDIGTVEGSGPGGRVTEADVRAAAESGSSGDEGSTDGASDPTATGAGATGDGEKQLKSAVSRIDDGESGDGAASADAGEDGGTAASAAASGAAGSEGAPPTVEGADRDRTLAAPSTRRVADELDVDLDAVPTDATRDGEPYVDEAAVREYAELQQRAQAADAAAAAEGGAPEQTAAAGEAVESDGVRERREDRPEGGPRPARAGSEATRERREPYRGVRKTIGEAMERSKFTAPHVTHHDTVDVTELVAARERLKPRAEERGVKLTYLPFVMKAAVAALKEHPVLNTSLDEENEEIVYKHYYDLGVATATDAGLMVPVVEEVDRKGLLELADDVTELTAKARDRSISREELRGSTFSITNFGAIGGEYATPIVNYPETAILGLGEITERPMVKDGEVVPRDVMTISLSVDHRVVDGADAARFANTLKEYLEDPTLLLLE